METSNVTFKYRFLSRPMNSFSCPMDNFIAFHEDAEYRKFGIVEYSKPLPLEQAKHFSLAPLFYNEFEGKKVNFFDDLVGTIELKNNPGSGQLFFVVTYDDDPTTIVWHQFVEHLLSGRYKMVD